MIQISSSKILSNSLYKQLIVFEALIASPGWRSATSLSTELSMSEKSVYIIIKNLSMNFPFLEIFTSRNKGIKMELSTGVGMQRFYSHILELSLECQLLEIIFFGKNNHIDEVLDNLYVSESTLNRMVSRCNSALKVSGFIIIRRENRYCFSGDELAIRYFMTAYLSEKYIFEKSPFSDELINISKDIFELFEKYFNVKKNSYSRVLTGMSVSLVRISIESCLTTWSDELNLYNPQFQLIDEELMELFKKHRMTSYFKKFRYQFISLFFTRAHSFHSIETLHTSEINAFYWIEEIVSSYQLPSELPYKKKLQLSHELGFTAQTYFGQTFFIFNNKKGFYNQVSQEFPNFARVALSTFVRFFEDKDSNQGLFYELFYELFQRYPNLVYEIEKKRASARIFLIIEEHSIYKEFYIRYLNSFFNNQLSIDTEKIENKDYDLLLVVSDQNFSLSPFFLEMDTEVIVTNRLLSSEDYLNIKKTLRKFL
ncbi:hypothetical protein HBP99_17265 [Listeria booriae]|uniref:helix-turn-helix domain-containing protein n=1 Tax=Listeria booriae TaxID=1552123 RepID=UPI0016245E72|nr:helix-turn-helix domain-containing protein [Listeria booriae]MBC2370353.1 hypothetical protein [Listeria booriae]